MVTPPPARRPRRRAWLRVLVVTVVLAAYLTGHLWYGDQHHSFDLRIYFHAVRWWAGGHDLYSYSQPDPFQGRLWFTYPPFAALLMFPMAWLSLSSTITIFWTFNLLAIVVTTWWLVRPVAARHGRPWWYALGLAVPVASGLEPIRETVTFGQINMLIVLLTLGDLLFLVPRRSRWAGVGVGLATAIKLTPAIFVVYLLVTRRFRAAATAVGASAAAAALALVYRPQDSWRFFTSTLWDTSRVGRVTPFANQSMWAVLSRIAEPGQPSRALWLVLVLGVTGFGMWRAARACRTGDELAGVTLAGLVGALVSPVTWTHHIYWFVPILLILVDAATGAGRRGRVMLLAAAAVTAGTLTLGVVEVFDNYHWLGTGQAGTAWGFVLSNWYLLLMLAFLIGLPVRSLPPGEPPAGAVRPPGARTTGPPATTAAGGRRSVAAGSAGTDSPDRASAPLSGGVSRDNPIE